jgi:hypothetical protein
LEEIPDVPCKLSFLFLARALLLRAIQGVGTRGGHAEQLRRELSATVR